LKGTIYLDLRLSSPRPLFDLGAIWVQLEV